MQIFDLSNPSKPRLQQVVDTPGSAKSMTLYDGLLLVDDGPSGVFMIDVRDRERALPIGYWEMPMRAEQLAATTDGLVISDEHGGTMKVPLPRRLERIHLVSREELRAVVEKAEKGQRVYLYDDRDAGDVEIVVR